MEAGWEGAGGQCPAHTSHEINPLLNFKTSRREFARSLVFDLQAPGPRLFQTSFPPPPLQSFRLFLTIVFPLVIDRPHISFTDSVTYHCFDHSFHVKIIIKINLISFSPFDRISLVNLELWIPSLLLSFLRSNTPSSAANLSLIALIFIVTYLFVPFDSISGPSLPPGPAPTPFPSSSPSPFPPSPPPPSGHGPFPHLPNSLLLSC